MFVFLLHSIIDLMHSRLDIKLFGSGHLYVKRSEFIEWLSGKSRNPDKMNFKNLLPWISIMAFDQAAHLGSLYVVALLV